MDKELKELIVVKGKVIEQERGYSTSSGKQISYEKGAKMVKRHFDENPDDVIAHFLGKDTIERILSQPDCIGIRAFHGLNELGIKQLILVGVNTKGKNILEVDTTTQDKVVKEPGMIITNSSACPPYCAGTSEDSGSGSINWW